MRDYQNTRELLPRDHERVFDGMTSRDRWTEPFERARLQVRAVAYRMLGSLNDAEDAVQEAFLRLNRTETAAV